MISAMTRKPNITNKTKVTKMMAATIEVMLTMMTKRGVGGQECI